jgi:hypothetical protein
VKRLAIGLAVLALTGCGSSNTPASQWDSEVNAGPGGKLDVTEYNDFLAKDGEVFATSPIAVVTEFLRLDTVDALKTTVDATRPGESRDQATVVVTLDGLLDDSIRSARYDIGVHRDATQLWSLTDARLTVRCHAGRGHPDFSAEPCV